MVSPLNPFFAKLTEVINSGQSRSVILTGNIYDLFCNDVEKEYVPLVDFLSAKCKVPPNGTTKGITQVIYRVNCDVVIEGDGDELCKAWKVFKGDNENDNDLPKLLDKTNGNPTFAFEILRQLTVCARKSDLKNNLLIIVEGADLLLPQDEIARMSLSDRQRIAVVQNWFCDPDFMRGHDTVILIAESRSLIHRRVSSLPQTMSLDIPNPGIEERGYFIQWNHRVGQSFPGELVLLTAGLSLHAMRQLMCKNTITQDDIMRMVEEYITQQLGDGVVEFKRPTHNFKDVIGFRIIKKFLVDEVIPRFRAEPAAALPGAAVGGPIGGGKTYICEALAAELELPVLILKNLRSKWFGETDIIIERLQRILEVFYKIVIFVDEADTAFGGVGGDVHETERRLTGKIQAMMSDPALRGRVLWLLMTARIDSLSPDIRRPGRVGDLIIPILDPEDDDRTEFLKWVLGGIGVAASGDPSKFATAMTQLEKVTVGYSSAAFAALRSLVKAKGCKTAEDILKAAEDMIPSDIGATRRLQTLQALMNCTRFSLMPGWVQKDGRVNLEAKKKEWRDEIASLERTMQG